MTSDFYLPNRRALAGYFEKEWFDHVLAQGDVSAALFEYARFDPSQLYSRYHERTARVLNDSMVAIGAAPARLLDVGSALGRGLYEVYRRTPSLRQATLVEPSRILATTFDCLFRGEATGSYPVLRGNSEMVEVAFNSSHLREAVRGLDISLLNSPHQELDNDLGPFDLVTCFNVVDNCQEPLDLIERLQRYTATGGVLALSCTYQWSKKNLGTAAERAAGLLEPVNEPPTRNITSLFSQDWSCLADTNIEFAVRKNERYWALFLSHVAVFHKR